MATITLTDLAQAVELDHDTMKGLQGGRMKIIGPHGYGSILTSADGEPVDVYVDGSLQNSVTTGYFHG